MTEVHWPGLAWPRSPPPSYTTPAPINDSIKSHLTTLSRSIGATVHSVFIISHTAEQLQGSGKLKYADISILDGINLAFLKLSSLI